MDATRESAENTALSHQLSVVGQKSDRSRVAVSLTDNLRRISAVQLRKAGGDTGAALSKSDDYWENQAR